MSPDTDDLPVKDSIEITKEMASPRVIKTHLSLPMLPNDFLQRVGKVKDRENVQAFFKLFF